MESEHIKPFIDQTKEMFGEFSIKVIDKTPYLAKKEDQLNCDISTTIGISGDVSGIISLSFKNDLAKKIGQAFYNEEEINEEQTVDAIMELINCIAGRSKEKLEKYKLHLTPPSLSIGVNHKIFIGAKGSIVVIPFETEDKKYTFNLAVVLSL